MVAIPIPSGEGQNIEPKEAQKIMYRVSSQYLYLLVKVRTEKSEEAKSPGGAKVAIPIPSGEGQNSGRPSHL